MKSGKIANESTQYSLGSLPKPMTGLALTKLADSNKIYIDSLESQYVKDPSYTSSFKVKELASYIAGIPHDTPGHDNTEIVDPKNHKILLKFSLYLLLTHYYLSRVMIVVVGFVRTAFL